MTQVRFSPRPLALLAAGCLSVLMAACGSASRSSRDNAAAFNQPRPVILKAETKFFNGQVSATLAVSRGFQARRSRSRYSGVEQTQEDQLMEMVEEIDPEDKQYGDKISKILALEVRGSQMPPVMLQLQLTNHGNQPIEVKVVELNSELGNFAVQPEKLTLESGKAAEADPMTSQMGITGSNIPVKIGLRIGDQTETQTVIVKSILPADDSGKPATLPTP